jgi:hypothetical protein
VAREHLLRLAEQWDRMAEREDERTQTQRD